ncbi:hypothetical protein JXB02_00985 [Candidatus Woesearchaeota archaeon]|nr:hypothetical protein [Candidatus Woesearchaeota archaeon]
MRFPIHKGATFLLFLALLCASAFPAQAQDYTVSAPAGSIEVCSCATFANPFLVTNLGGQALTFLVSQEGSAAQFTAYPDAPTRLMPGEGAAIYTYLNAPCGYAEGDYTLTTTITPTAGEPTTVMQPVRVDYCPNTLIQAGERSLHAGPCELAAFPFTIANIGTYPESYLLGVDPYAEYSGFSDNPIVMDPGTSLDVTYYVQLPCGMHGEYLFTVKAYGERSRVTTELPFTLTVEQDYPFVLLSTQKKLLCEDYQSQTNLTIVNLARFENTFTVALANTTPGFVTLNTTGVRIPGGDAAVVPIGIFPGDGEGGEYLLALTVTEGLGGTSEQQTIALSASDCFEPELTVAEEPLRICCGEATLPMMVGNEGKYDEPFVMSVGGAVWASLSETSFSLEPGEGREVSLRLSPACDGDAGSYELRVEATLADRGYADSATIPVTVLSADDCTRLIADLPERIRTYYTGRAVPIAVVNQGAQAVRFRLVMDAPEWIALDRYYSVLGPGETAEFQMGIYPHAGVSDDDYTVEMSLEVDDGSGRAYRSVHVVDVDWRIDPVGMMITARVWVMANPCQATNLSLVALVLVLIAISFIRRTRDLSNRWIFLITAGLLILLLLSLFWCVHVCPFNLSCYYEPHAVPPLEDEVVFITWDQDTGTTVDLSAMFYDPDNDTLTFDATPVQDITVRIDSREGIALLVPAPGWSGVRAIRFIAEDENGATASSPYLILKVEEVEPFSLGGWFADYYQTIRYSLLLAVLLLLLIVMVLLAATEKTERRRINGFFKDVEIEESAPAEREAARPAKAPRKRRSRTPRKRPSKAASGPGSRKR